MFDIFQSTTRPDANLFFRKNDANDPRLGETVSAKLEDYDKSEIVILGCPQDEGVARNKGRIGAALAPAAIRTQFYKLTTFQISQKIFDLGDTIIRQTLEETHDAHTRIVEQILRDGKRIIVLGGGNDVSYADARAASKVCGAEKFLALNVDAHFDVRADKPRNSGTPYRQLLEENLVAPQNFYEVAFQTHLASPVYFEYLKKLNANLTSLEEFQKSDYRFQQKFAEKVSMLDSNGTIFWGFDVDAVRAADAPGTSAPSPLGLSAAQFVALAAFAGEFQKTKIVEFTELNPNFDIDNRTAKLVAVAMHKFIAAFKR